MVVRNGRDHRHVGIECVHVDESKRHAKRKSECKHPSGPTLEWCARLHGRLRYRIYRERSWSLTMSASIFETYTGSMTTFFSFMSGASKLTMSSTRSMMVCSRRAPMFSVFSFT